MRHDPASKPKPAAQNSCLKCRDFRAVDAHAARFPREAIPSHDLSWLAHQLTDPFSSLTDKARALFTWLHHNIDYNVVAFFNNNVQPSTPASTIATGLAVCEGYAGLFTALATTIGLESVVIGGHGKGYGYSALPPGAPVPPFNCGHAWNAVRIDNGEWKLIDCCWGAGHLGDGQSYKRKFSPECFYMDNNEFGLKHFPENPRYFFRTDGRASIPWEEYIMAPPGANVFGHAGEAGLSLTSFQPQQREIKIHDPSPAAPHVVRFMFEKRCPHYDSEAIGEGKPYMFFLTTEGKDGRNKQFQPMDTDGRFYWKDVERLECGAPGQRVMACVGDKWNGGPDGSGRGVTRQMWEGNRYGFRSYAGVAVWELT
ncbi:Transglutaminase-like protein [Neofusicoccum parvum]|uniref:Transglutaminase-like protein n=1 Tax=Neofusicoccum parvum TaxID=310453 RepID=A0ACB5SB80_9PEZI|nr:Transglutaminase-like protein [Neofusicoccum parvum]